MWQEWMKEYDETIKEKELEDSMSKADKMFDDFYIPYEKKEGEFTLGYYFPNYDNSELHIIFNKQFPRINIQGDINTHLLQAINEKCKELGWIE